MKILRTRQQMVEFVRTHSQKKSIGFVPTMGFLHEGHLSLVRRAKAENNIVVVSIFVNPTQFAPHEDFQNYPRDLARDAKLLRPLADVLFCPSADEIYFDQENLTMDLGHLAQCLCGYTRPYHFPGVALVLTKFFQIVRPQRVYFGQKDFQQTVVVRELIRNLFFDIELVACPTVREADGLAMSSRNAYLSKRDRAKAHVLYQALISAQALFKQGERKSEVLRQKVEDFLKNHQINAIEYIDIRTVDRLQAVNIIRMPVVLAVCIHFGKTRLIDNILLNAT